MENIQDLIPHMLTIAKKYIHNAYAPYSKIRVVAVLKTEKGYFAGTNIENASYGLTICAERVAIFKAISEGARKFEIMLIYSPDVMPYPCGACRQVMSEFADGNFIVVVANDKQEEIFKLSELLPHTFKL